MLPTQPGTSSPLSRPKHFRSPAQSESLSQSPYRGTRSSYAKLIVSEYGCKWAIEKVQDHMPIFDSAYLAFFIIAKARINIVSNTLEYALIFITLCHTKIFPVQISIILPRTARNYLRTFSLETNKAQSTLSVFITVSLTILYRL